MIGKVLRAAIVGPSSLLGKELADELNESKTPVWDLTLLDAGEAGGHITAAGDEALIVQAISAEAFHGIDIAFFAGDPVTTEKYWEAAHRAGAGIVDLTGALEGLPQVLVRSALGGHGAAPDLVTAGVVSPHPAAVMLALAATRLQSLGLQRMAVTLLQPASEHGSAGVDEMHQQTVGLLSFQSLNKQVFDAQVAFNLLPEFGDAATVKLETVKNTIDRHVALLSGSEVAGLVSLQLFQAPVFHGYVASVFVELASAATEDQVRGALENGLLQTSGQVVASNEGVAGLREIVVEIEAANAFEKTTFWLCMAADNLRLAARSAVACGVELAELRPASSVN